MNTFPKLKYLDFGNPDTTLTALINEIMSGMRVIESIDDAAYRRSSNTSGSVGAQFRHNLDFLLSLLNGIDSGRIDFSDRKRDLRVEMDREFAVSCFADVIRRLTNIHPRTAGKSVLVRSEINVDTWLPSSVGREVEFVHSHTVHHHALICEKLVGFGIAVGSYFGVAPSTLEFWEKKAA